MNADKCPKCGAALDIYHSTTGTTIYECGHVFGGVAQAERDALAARVKELVEAGNELERVALSNVHPTEAMSAAIRWTKAKGIQMSDHIVDANKMVPTPRTDAAFHFKYSNMGRVVCEQLERELAAANARIAELIEENNNILHDASYPGGVIECAMKLRDAQARIALLEANQCEKEPCAWDTGSEFSGVKANDTDEPIYRKAKV